LSSKSFREICVETGQLKLDVFENFERGKIYAGGNMLLLNEQCNITAGNDVLYVGDHIFSDVMITKKKHAWRTLLIIPELTHELQTQLVTAPIAKRLRELDSQKRKFLKN